MRRGLVLVGVVSMVFCVLCGLSVIALALPEGRAYEMVSPVYKGGFGVLNIEAVSPGGESVAFYSPGAFNGAPSGLSFIDYVAYRGVSGWSTLPEMTPAVLLPVFQDRDISSTLETVVILGKPGPNSEAATQLGTEEQFLFHPADSLDTSITWELGGMPLKLLTEAPITVRYEGGSADLCHLLLAVAGNHPFTEALLPEAVNTTKQVYELSRGCGGVPPSLKLVALNAKGKAISPLCKVDIGIQDYNTVSASAYNAVSADGSEIFFTTCVNGEASHHQLFVRLGGTKTLEVSKPVGETETCVEVVLCEKAATRAPADFAGASADGSRVFFTTTAQLSGEDKDAGNDLYMATIGCREGGTECGVSEKTVTSLVQVSHDSAVNESAEVQGVVRVAPDGSHIYFIARGILSGEQNAESSIPIKGADNLYAYDAASGRVAFVGDLCSGVELSGTVEDVHCPSKTGTDIHLWLSNAGEAQTGGAGGQFLVFSTYSQLTKDDTDAAKDVYRYDAETGVLTRVSAGEAGYKADGNDSSFDAAITEGHKGGTVLNQYEMDNRAVSEDGTHIVFMTAEPLSPAATNNLTNVYEWHEDSENGEDEVSLISSGSANGPVNDTVISHTGQDIFFRTVQGLVSQDTDGAPDVYDARVAGGFAVSPVSREPCSSDACQGPLTNPTPLLVPGSASQVAGENFASAKAVVSPKAKTKKNSKARKSKKSKGNAKRAARSRRKVNGRVIKGGGQ